MVQNILNVGLFGDLFVGKSSIVKQFVHNDFDEYEQTTIGVSFSSKKINIDNNEYKIYIWDTTGEKKCLNILYPYCKIVDIAIIIYDVTNLNSFINLENWIKLIKDTNSKCKIIIVGNKCDLDKKRKITKIHIQELDKHDITYQEVSAKQKKNVHKMFYESIKEYLNSCKIVKC